MMTIVEGERLKNKSTQDLFKIKKIENEKVVLLEDEKGFIRIWFPREQLGSIFEKVNPSTPRPEGRGSAFDSRSSRKTQGLP
jgi:hypothetical protein